MKESNFKYFPNALIDDIQENPEYNYFTPVLSDTLTLVGSVSKICDIGCGNGIFSICLKLNPSLRLIGVDGSKYALGESLKIGFDEAHHINDFSQDTLPIENEYADLVICKDVLEHLLIPEHLIDEINRITSPKGFVLVHVPNHFPFLGRLKFLFKNDIDTFNYFPNSKRWNFPHIRFFNKQSIIDLMELSSFEIVKDLSWHFIRPSFLKRFFPRFSRIIGNKFSDFSSEGITILFKKR